ncbi:autophagy protein Apg5-domain-containing protein [Bisporella sp. PMI_857]|nr:autophagy protein Apg5-domain-containing protein [Bisporella sp. PMI_857]
MQSQIWSSTIPLQIAHQSSPIPYLIQVPRLSYLPLLLSRLTTFFGPASSFSYQGILLKNLPVGLLYDLYQPELPWRLDLGDGPLFDIHDTYINSVKEADFVRNGNAKGIMSMSKDNSTRLWNSVQDNDFSAFHKINAILLNPPSPLKNIPLRVYIPSSAPSADSEDSVPVFTFKIIQSLIPPTTSSRETQTLGTALNKLLPSLFPSRRDAILAEPVLHGAPVPFHASLEELMREAAYADGWIHLSIKMLEV